MKNSEIVNNIEKIRQFAKIQNIPIGAYSAIDRLCESLKMQYDKPDKRKQS